MTIPHMPLYSQVERAFVRPCGDMTEWAILCADPKTADTANLLKPSAITRDGQNKGILGGRGTTALVCLRYVTGQDVTTALVVQLVGITEAGVPQLLSDADGADSFTFDAVSASDMQDADGFSYTPAIEVDLQNCEALMALVVTAAVGGGTVALSRDNAGWTTTGPAVMARAK